MRLQPDDNVDNDQDQQQNQQDEGVPAEAEQ